MRQPVRLTARATVQVVLMALLLASCVRHSPPGHEPEEPSPATLLEVSLQVSAGPVSAEGLTEPLTVLIRATDALGEPVTFNDGLLADPEGSLDSFTLGPDMRFAVVSLIEDETYDFQAHAFDSTGSFVASGTARHTVAADRGNAINLALSSHLGAVTLEPRLPITTLVPGQEVELLLSVSAHGRPDLVVPASSYAVSFEVRNGETVAHGARGITFRAEQHEPGSATVMAAATGLVVEDGVAIEGKVDATFTRGFGSAIGVDIENPEVSDLSFDPGRLTLFGVASDNFGIASLDVYEGPVHLASTDLDLVEAHGIAPVTFPGGGTAFFAVLDLGPGTFELTAVATDASGNHSELSREVSVP